MSRSVSIVTSESQGRHAMARQTIAPGSIVAAGQPTVALLNPDNKQLMMSQCLECLAEVTRVSPCLTCSSVVFCSDQCRHKAVFHR